jgi:hypothetical protein
VVTRGADPDAHTSEHDHCCSGRVGPWRYAAEAASSNLSKIGNDVVRRRGIRVAKGTVNARRNISRHLNRTEVAKCRAGVSYGVRTRAALFAFGEVTLGRRGTVSGEQTLVELSELVEREVLAHD